MITLQYMKGAAAHDADAVLLRHPDFGWRLGWLWAHYKLFPKLEEWRRYDFIELDSHVLAVALLDLSTGRWIAYIGAVSGRDHDEEWSDAVDYGSKLAQAVAEKIFEKIGEHFEWEG